VPDITLAETKLEIKNHVRWDIGLIQEPGWFFHKSSKKRRFLTKSAVFVVFMWLLFKN
jgi:hypothetical protein